MFVCICVPVKTPFLQIIESIRHPLLNNLYLTNLTCVLLPLGVRFKDIFPLQLFNFPPLLQIRVKKIFSHAAFLLFCCHLSNSQCEAKESGVTLEQLVQVDDLRPPSWSLHVFIKGCDKDFNYANYKVYLKAVKEVRTILVVYYS
jgi:hypothetical protein